MAAAHLGAPPIVADGVEADPSCDGKTRYPNPAAAHAAIKQRAWRAYGPMKVYHCRRCGFWHVGRTTKLERNVR